MALETGTYVSDLVAANPPGTDKKKQGDDHIRLIKSVLQATFPNADKGFRFPSATAKSANYTVLSTDDNVLLYIDTTAGAITLTLPTLAAGDKGWMIRVVKVTTDANPIFIAPPAGTINGFTKVRRSVEHVPFWVMWTGTVFIASRQFGVPIGARIPFHGATLPNGTLWPDGATFTAANFVELNTVLAGNTKPDTRGRIGAGRDDMGGVAQNRITNTLSGIVGTTKGATGGGQSAFIGRAELTNTSVIGSKNVQRASSNAIGPVVSSTSVQVQAYSTGSFVEVYPKAEFQQYDQLDLTNWTNISINGNNTQTQFNKMPPTFIQNEVLVAE